MLEQRIPATYLALEDVVGILATEQKNKGNDPVLPSEEYRIGVANIMHSRFRMSFRDTAELNQVRQFLRIYFVDIITRKTHLCFRLPLSSMRME